MPVLFVGHGSPMNAVEDNEFSHEWRHLGKDLPRPSAILSISAHWYSNETMVTAMDRPRTIHDFYGFPKELFAVEYPAPGSKALSDRVRRLITTARVVADTQWGLDHGTWSVLRRMYPRADVPVVQLSLDGSKPAAFHFKIGAELKRLREEGVLIVGSGNIVHNLSEADWKSDLAYPWAEEFDRTVKEHILDRDFEPLVEYESLGEKARRSIPTNEHYLPMLYVLGASVEHENIGFFNEKVTLGSVGMRGFVIGGGTDSI
jgi:4,5-DOPA dioxygenase extradiol